MFNWDPAKALSNLAKHGVSFEEAASVFSDPEAIAMVDAGHSEVEERWHRIGTSAAGRVLTVVCTPRRIDGTQIARIISARPADKNERAALASAARFRDRLF